MKQYLVAAPGCDKSIKATYNDSGDLTALEGIHHLSSMWENVCINSPIPLKEKEISQKLKAYEGMVTFQEIKMTKVEQKIAMFCAAYKQHFGVSYKKHRADVSAIKKLEIDEKLLKLYFTNQEWWGKQPKSIRNLANNYNSLLQMQSAPKKKVKKEMNYPDHPDKDFERKLKTSQLPGYWQHLRGLGYSAVRATNGEIVNWTKKASIIILLLLLACSCMTEKRALKYISKHPHILENKYDTLILLDTVAIDKEVIIPPKQGNLDFGWQWNQTTDTVYITKNNDIEIEVRAKAKPSKRRTDFEFKALVKPDTITVRDTVQIEQRTATQQTVVVHCGWNTKIIWGSIGLVLGLLIMLFFARWVRRK